MSKKTLEQRIDDLEKTVKVFKEFQEELNQYNQSNFDKGLKDVPLKALENLKALLDILQKQTNVSTLNKYEISKEIFSLNEIIEKESQLNILKQIVDLEKKIIELIRI
ncbi:hypothetical protein [Anaerovorax sp. IOR16]|uniref:hypothetical protein n=1 Tax=Anaerovorax sp. IOR16 TaxID=2773458 RepID=UPI0019D2F12D|nr:hypothetical protein [Anaerovorax sp. IOR16]